jgi:cytochrome d ubiquinol oxidase subunit I
MSPRLHLLCGLPIVVAGFTGSLFVISVNAWMNNPSGFRLEGGRAVDVEPWVALFGNGQLWPELTHMYLAGFIVAGFVVAAAYAWGWLKGRRGRYERVALAVPLTIAALAAPVQVVAGDWIARRVAEDQPTKLAAFEGLGKTTRGAPIHVLGWYGDGEVRHGIEIPKLLSLLAQHDPNATVRGLEAAAPDDRPPVNVVRVAFQTMVGIGTLLAALGVLHLVAWYRRRRFVEARWFHWAVVAAGPASVVALIAGWVATEVGRQPWVVYGVMRTSAAVTGADGVPVGYGTLVVVYLALGAAVAWILRRLAGRPLELPPEPPPILEAHGAR